MTISFSLIYLKSCDTLLYVYYNKISMELLVHLIIFLKKIILKSIFQIFFKIYKYSNIFLEIYYDPLILTTFLWPQGSKWLYRHALFQLSFFVLLKKSLLVNILVFYL